MTDQEAPLSDEQPDPYQIIGAITSEESILLSLVGDPESDPNVADMYEQRFIGHAIGEAGKAYALVTVEDEQGELQGSHYVYLGKDDFGTTIKPETADSIGLPSPSDSLASLTGNMLPSKSERPVNVEAASDDLSGDAKSYFDMLTAPEPANHFESAGLSFEREESRSPRLAKIFAPRQTRDEARATQPKPDRDEMVDSYRRIINGEAPLKQPETPQQAAHRELTEPYVDQPSEEQINDSLIRMRESEMDPVIEAIITKHVGSPIRDASTVEFMRTNADLRYELGSYLLRDKIPHMRKERPLELPARLHSGDAKKTPNHKGYYDVASTLKSDEYSVIIALAMLDGTFVKPHTVDNIVRNEHEYNDGTHRAAAAAVLSQNSQSAKYLESTLARNKN